MSPVVGEEVWKAKYRGLWDRGCEFRGEALLPLFGGVAGVLWDVMDPLLAVWPGPEFSLALRQRGHSQGKEANWNNSGWFPG